jgi:hypothetical protein
VLRSYRNSFANAARKERDNSALRKKKSWLGVAPSQLISPHTNPSALVAVIIMIVMIVTMLPVVRRPIVIVCSVIRIPTVIVIIATGIIPVISRVAVVAVPVCRVTESDSDSSDPD